MARRVLLHKADEVARIGALSNGSNGQRSLESASLHFERSCGRERSGSPHAKSRAVFARDLLVRHSGGIRQFRLIDVTVAKESSACLSAVPRLDTFSQI